jgi:hypothetical protein
MSCQECNDSILNPVPPSLCVGCPENCATQMDLDCVVYHPDNDTPSTLYNLGLGNNVSAKTILEKIDFLIGQNFNIDLTVQNTSTIILTTSGPAKHVLSAALKISPDAGNKIEIRGNGVYVA